MNTEYLDAFGRITLHTEYDNDGSYDCINFEDDCSIVESALQRLESIDNLKEIETLNNNKSYVIYCINNYHNLYMNYRGEADSFELATIFNNIYDAHKFLREKGTNDFYMWKIVDVDTLSEEKKVHQQ